MRFEIEYPGKQSRAEMDSGWRMENGWRLWQGKDIRACRARSSRAGQLCAGWSASQLQIQAQDAGPAPLVECEFTYVARRYK